MPLTVFYGIQLYGFELFSSLLSFLLQEEVVDSLDKDLDIKDLKEQVVSLSGLLRQLRLQKDEFDGGNKSQVSFLVLFSI